MENFSTNFFGNTFDTFRKMHIAFTIIDHMGILLFIINSIFKKFKNWKFYMKILHKQKM